MKLGKPANSHSTRPGAELQCFLSDSIFEPRWTTPSVQCRLRLADHPGLAKSRICWTALSCLWKVNTLLRRAMMRTMLLQPEAGVEEAPFAVTRMRMPFAAAVSN